MSSAPLERSNRKTSPFDSSNPSRSIQNRGLSLNGSPEVGQNVVQFPQSLQKSAMLTICTA